MPPLSESTIETLRQEISPEASFSNPLDMVAGAGAREFRVTLEAIKDDERYDCVLPILVPPKTLDQLEVAKSIHDALEGTSKTVIACLMGAGKDSVGVEFLRDNGIPVSIYPESAAKTLQKVLRYRAWLDRPRGTMRSFDVDRDAVREKIDATRASGSKSIIGQPAIKILEAYGIQAEAYSYATTEDEAVEKAREIGLPVVMKIDSPKMLHKTEKGGVIVDLHVDDEVRKAFGELRERARRHGDDSENDGGDAEFRVALQRMVHGGVETVMGMSYDPSFGPLLMFGLGGIYVEVMKDVSFKIHPLSDAGADEMIRALRSYPLLTGFRGAPSVDLDYLREALLRLSQLVADFDEFEEIDVNPFMASAERSECVAVDARFVLRDAEATRS